MADIEHKRFSEPEGIVPYAHGRAAGVQVGDAEVWRSELDPGWSWEADIQPNVGGAKSCPMTHREYVVSGRIRYRMDDGAEVEASGGDVLFIPPGHQAWVVGEERCVLIDW